MRITLNGKSQNRTVRWTASYLAESAINEAVARHGENWLDAVEYGKVISYTSADHAAAAAAESDIYGEAKCVTEQHWDEGERAWFDAE